MRIATTSYLLAVASTVSAMKVSNDPRSIPHQPPARDDALQPHTLPAVFVMAPAIEERQGAPAVAPVPPPPAQYPSITTMFFPTILAAAPGVTTYLPTIYTQTFAAIPDQWPTAGSGSIGYGSPKTKREALPEVTPAPAGIAEIDVVGVIVLELPMVYITQPVQAITEIIIFQTVTVSGNATYNGTLGTGMGNRSLSGFGPRTTLPVSSISSHLCRPATLSTAVMMKS